MAMASTSIASKLAAAPAPHSRSRRLDARIPAGSVCLPPQPHKLAVEIREKRASSTTSRERPRRHRESKWWEVADKRQGTLLDDDSYVHVEEATPSSNFMDEDLRREIITYGDLSQACYDGFDNDRHSSSRGNCRYHPTELLAQSVAGLDQEYEITKYLYATTDLELPSIFGRPKEGEKGPWSRDSNWMGFVAVSRPSIGKRHIVVAWRGTVTGTEWLENLQDYLTPTGLDPSDTFTAGVKVESGFLDIYTASKASSRYNKLSARQQLICEVWRLKEKFRDEDVSITVTGHSLGGALALLSAYDLAELGLAGDTTQTPTTVVSFSAPRVGNRRFAERCKQLNLKVLRVLNKRDIVPKVPGILLNEQHRSWTLGEILPWAYWHVGTEFALDSGLSPFLRENADLTACHNLEGLLHLVDGYRGPLEEFRPSGMRDLALVNKDSDLLHPRLGIPSFWRSKSHSYQQIKHSSSL